MFKWVRVRVRIDTRIFVNNGVFASPLPPLIQQSSDKVRGQMHVNLLRAGR